MRKAVSVTSLTLAITAILPGVAHADEASRQSPTPTIEESASEVSIHPVGSNKRLVKVVAKSTGIPTVEKKANEEIEGSKLIVTEDHKGTQIRLMESASITSAEKTPEQIRQRLKVERNASAQQGSDEVSLMLEQTSHKKAEEARKKLEEKRKKEEQRRARAERDRAEALRILASGSSSLGADGNPSTESFNLQMGGDIPGNNTSRTADGSTIRDAGMSARGKRIAEESLKHLGAAYVWGGESPTAGWDCSGFVQWLYAREGVAVPRVAIDQARAAVKVSRPMAGDLVLQNNGSHIGIYLGGGKMISAWSPDVGTIVHEVDVLPYEFYRVPGAGESIPSESLASTVRKNQPTAVVAPAPTPVRTPPAAAPEVKLAAPKTIAPKVVKPAPAAGKPAEKKSAVKAPRAAAEAVKSPSPSTTPSPRPSAAATTDQTSLASTPSPAVTSYEIVDGGPVR